MNVSTRRSHDVDDDDDAFDERGILKDGRSLKVPLFLRDGAINPDLPPLQRAIAQDVAAREAKQRAYEDAAYEMENSWKPAWLRDQERRSAGQPKPAKSDAGTVDAREEAYRLADEEMCNAWKPDWMRG